MEILISGYINYGEENSSSGFSGQISYVVEWNHSTSREAAGFDSPVRERGDGKASKGLSSKGATLCDTVRHEGNRVPALPGLDDLFADDPRPYGTWLFNVDPSGLWLRPSQTTGCLAVTASRYCCNTEPRQC